MAIALAIVGEAPIIWADEPAGNLDTKTTVEIATWSERVLRFRDGKLIADEAAPKMEELESEAKGH